MSVNLRKACQVLHFHAVSGTLVEKGQSSCMSDVSSLAPACFTAHVVHCSCWCSAAPLNGHPSVPGACISTYLQLNDTLTLTPTLALAQFMCVRPVVMYVGSYSTGNIGNLL